MRKLHLQLHDVFLKIVQCDNLIKDYPEFDHTKVKQTRLELQKLYAKKLGEIASKAVLTNFKVEDYE